MKKYYIFFALLFVLSSVAGFAYESIERDKRVDQKVLDDLLAIQDAVRVYTLDHSSLPKDISQLKVPEKVQAKINDYEYKKVSSDKYQLCAQFKTESKSRYERSDMSLYDGHAKGHHCFTLREYVNESSAKDLPLRR